MTQPINLPPLSEVSSSREHLRMHRALLDDANGVVRARTMDLASSYDTATGTGGIFLDPVGGDDLAPGTEDQPVKSMLEIDRRLAGAVFPNSKRPVIRLQDDTTLSDDGILGGFETNEAAIIGRDMILEPALILAAASDLDPATEMGSIQVSGFDFTSFVADTAHTVWVRRQDSATSVVYAPLVRLGSTVDTVFVGKHVQWASFPVAGESIATPLAAGQAIDLVRFPRLSRLRSGMSSLIRLSRVDSLGATRSNVGLFVVGHVNSITYSERVNVQGTGVYYRSGVVVPFTAVGFSASAFSIGSSSGAAASANFQCAAQVTSVSSERASMAVTSGGRIRIARGFTHGAAQVFSAIEVGAVSLVASYGGSANGNAVSVGAGGRFFGANFTTGLGAGASTWFVDGVSGTQPAAPVLGNNGSAIYP